jgi:hypothetical protein
VIITEWEPIRRSISIASEALGHRSSSTRAKIGPPEDMHRRGFAYVSVGRPNGVA